MNLTKLLRPKSIAVIGASERSGFAKSTCVNLMKSPHREHIYFVNPTKDEVFGVKCYPDMASLPEVVDCCVIIVSKSRVPEMLEQAAAAGCKAAVVYASGYGETGNPADKQAEQELRELAAKLDVALMGTNCAGYINNIDGFFPFGMIVEGDARPGGIGIISQSGKICLNMMQVDYLSCSYLISSGNSTCLTVEDYMEFLVDDEDTKVLGLYLEGVKNPEKFTAVLAKAARKRKPVVVLKVGKSEKGGQVAASHTGSMSGSDKSFDAVAKKFGLIRVDDLEELMQTCHLFNTLPKLPEKATFATLSLSGGETGISADVSEAYGIEFPAFAPETVTKLKNTLPDYASIHNPLDMTATPAHNAQMYGGAVQAAMEDPGIGMVVCSFTILESHNTTDIIYPMSDGMLQAVQKGGKPLALMSFFGGSRDRILRDKLEGAGIPILPPTVYGYKILGYLRDYVRYNPAEHNLDLAIPQTAPGDGKRQALSEFDSKRELERCGVKVPKGIVIRDAAEYKSGTIPFPLVCKIESDEILHKSDVGGVKLNLRDDAQVAAAVEEILANVRKNAPGAAYRGVLVQEMLPAGVEIILGVTVDPQFGPMLLCGLGGIFVEIFQDVSLYPCPLGKAEARAMLESLKGFRMLTGYRGGKPCDVDALVSLMVQLSDYAKSNKDSLLEMDLNPVFVYAEGEGVGIADALIVRRAGAEN